MDTTDVSGTVLRVTISKTDGDNPDFMYLRSLFEEYLDVRYSEYHDKQGYSQDYSNESVKKSARLLRETYKQNDASLLLDGVFVAYCDDVPVGICGYVKIGNKAELKKLFVLPERSEGNIATSLLLSV